MTLTLYERLAAGTTGKAYMGDLNAIARGWRRSKRAIGGFWTGSFHLSQEDLRRTELVEFYNLNIGCRLLERTHRLITWEGYIVEMRLTQQNSVSMISLRPEVFHNRVRVYYINRTGSRIPNAWDENADSSGIFGQCCYIVPLGNASGVQATARRQRELSRCGWPRSRLVGDTFASAPTNPRASRPDTLEVVVAGYWHTLNWRYLEATSSGTASAVVSALLAASEYITDGRIETNADLFSADCYLAPARLGDLIADIVAAGDTSAAIWKGGVYRGREFTYEQVPDVVAYNVRQGRLYDQGIMEVPFEFVDPGFLVRNHDAPTGWPLPGATALRDDARIGYVDEVELVAGPEYNTLRLRYEDAASGGAYELRQQGMM